MRISKQNSKYRQYTNKLRRRTTFYFSFALCILITVFALTGCGNSELTLSQRIEAWENWKLPGLRDDAPASPTLPDAGTEGMTLAEMEAAAAEAEAAAQEEARVAAQLWARSTVLGEWSELSDSLPLFRPIVSWYGNLKLLEDGTYSSGSTTGTWEVNEDGSQLILRGTRGKTVADIVQDGAYTKLSVPELRLNFLRSRELDDYIEEHFVFVRITKENVDEYIGKPVNIGVILDEKDRPTNESAWVLSSPAYEDGLVYYGRSEDFKLELQNNATGSRTVSIPYDTLPLVTGATFGHVNQARGTLVYVHQKFVADNRMTDARTRTLTFTDGTTHTTSLTWYSDLADYKDWRF